VTDRLETITINAGGIFLPWQDVSVSISAEEAVRTAVITGHIPPGMSPPWPDDKATLMASGDLLLTGYVRDLRPDQGSDDWRATITLVSRTVDAVETSILHKTGLVENKDIKGIGEAFDNLGIGIEAKGSFETIAKHQIEPGESLYSTLEPLARAEAAIIHDTPEGKLRIVKKPEGSHSGGLAAGVNIISASAEFSGQGKFDPVIVRGQQSRGVTPQALRPEAKASDPSVGRSRPRIVVLDGEGTASHMKNAVEWEARAAAGLAVNATIVVSGWRDQGGKVWTPNWLVYVRHPRIYLDQMMVIKSVQLSQDTRADGDGTRATLTLADPRALGGSSSGSKSGKGWSAPEPQAEYSAE
jgi:prophage tail gpP-like protein